MSVDLVRYLEELAANAWPPEVMQIVDGWRLRYSRGVGRRANSVWPNATNHTYGPAEKIELVEAFYARFGLPARFQICPAAVPAELDDELAARGYRRDALTHLQTAVLSTLLTDTATPSGPAVTIHESWDEAWFTFHRDIGGATPLAAEVRRGIMRHIGPPTAFAIARSGAAILGIGLGVVERGAIGVFNMLTHPAERRRGVATATVHALARWGQARGATQMYLQVMDKNRAGKALYGRLGFRTLYHYHFRTQAG